MSSDKRSKNFLDLTNQKFDRLLVMEFAGKRSSDGLVLWKCKCDCGNEIVAAGKQLRRKQTRSCGCLQIEKTRLANTSHGFKGTRIYRIWSGMLDRVRNPKNKDYENYGGRGITVDQRWLSFENFLADMGQPPSEEHSIDRKEVDKGYFKDNCKWSTPKEQANNKRNNKMIHFGNVCMTLSQWSDKLGIDYDRLCGRLLEGWSVFDAFTTPVNKKLARRTDVAVPSLPARKSDATVPGTASERSVQGKPGEAGAESQ